MIRFSGAIAAVAVAAALGSAQPPKTLPRPKMLSELPMPKAGLSFAFSRGEIATIKNDEGVLEVIDIVEKEERATIRKTIWDIDADGWFDAEGFNLVKAYPRSGLWAMRTAKGNRPPGAGSGLPTAQGAVVPNTPPRLYRAGPGDIITHIDGIAVTSYERYVFAINNAKNPRDLAILVMNGETGRRHVYYITAFKTAIE